MLNRWRLLCALFGLVLGLISFQNCGPDFKATLSNTELSSDSGGGLESDLSCEPDFHFEGGECVANILSCEVTNGVGQQVWANGMWSPCEVVSCRMGYQNQANVCVFSPLACPIDFGQGQTQENGTCLLVNCNSGYHRNGNRCELSTRSCMIANGSGQQTWNGTAFGACLAVSCQQGFQLMNGQCVANPVVTNPSWAPRSTARFFLTGHSLTDDPLASLIVSAAQSRGDTVAYNQQIIIGSPIRSRTRGGSSTGWAGYQLGKNRDGSTGINVVSELRNPQTIGAGQRYDTLIIAENHNSLDMIQWENTIGFLRHYHDRLIEGNPNGRTLFYNTWLDLNKSNPAPWIEFEKRALVAWECVASKVNLTLQSSGRNDRVLNLPVSAALVYLVEQAIDGRIPGLAGTTLQRMNMIFSDNVHLTPLGFYYVSLVTYSALYGKSPVGASRPSGISAETASALQATAWFYINSYYSQANPGVRDMVACRDYISQQVCPAYWSLKGNANGATGCRNFFTGNETPFRWPDASFAPLPAP